MEKRKKKRQATISSLNRNEPQYRHSTEKNNDIIAQTIVKLGRRAFAVAEEL